MRKIMIAMVLMGSSVSLTAETKNINWEADRFADTRVLRSRFPGFEDLSLKQKMFAYYLSEAALSGRDIIFDQNNRYNLRVRNCLEHIYASYSGDRKCKEFKAFEEYLKRLWFAGGIHHHYSNEKFVPAFSEAYFDQLLKGSPPFADQRLPSVKQILFDPAIAPLKISKNAAQDLVVHSSGNYYKDVTQKEAEDFYAKLSSADGTNTPPSYGLNSRLVKENGTVKEQVWKVGGMYSPAIERIVSCLNKALPYAGTPEQASAIQKLISFYRSGDLKEFDAFNIQWLNDGRPDLDFVNGFTEVYGDPLARKGAWEALVNYKDKEASKRVDLVCENAQWFEDHSPIDPQYKKDKVVGVSAKVINYIMLGGDAYPSSPLGINLPNAAWIRRDHGSKSVSIQNISDAFSEADAGAGKLQEFSIDQAAVERAKKYGALAGYLLTDLHECLGHGSAKLAPGINGDELKNYSNAIEEARATLFSLYFLADKKLQEIGIVDSEDCYKAGYESFMSNALLMQLSRIQPGRDIVQAHMRCRKMIAEWVMEKGKPQRVMEYVKKEGKTYLRINDYAGMKKLIGDMLREVQRIKSTGDYAAAMKMVEDYGVKVDPQLHQEVIARMDALHIAGFTGFMNPVLKLVKDKSGKITDVRIENNESYVHQNMRYSSAYHFLSPEN